MLGFSQSNISLNNSSPNYLQNQVENNNKINELKANLTNIQKNQIKDGKEHRPIQTQYYKRKRNYNEMSEESSCKLSNSDYPFNTRKLKTSSKEDHEDQKKQENLFIIIIQILMLMNGALLRLMVVQKTTIINVVLLSVKLLR